MIEKDFTINNQISIVIENNTAMVHTPCWNNGRSLKTLKLDTLIQAFQKFGLGVETPILPRNCIKYKEKGNTMSLVLAYPPTKFTATMAGNVRTTSPNVVYENCPRPGVLMIFDLRMNEDKSFYLNNSKAYCFKEDIILLNKRTRVFMLPFPNIGEDGWICWGSNHVRTNYTSLMGLDNLINILFSAPFNHDLFRNTAFANIGIHTPSDLFEHLKDKDTFPDSLFVSPSRSGNLTIGDL